MSYVNHAHSTHCKGTVFIVAITELHHQTLVHWLRECQHSNIVCIIVIVVLRVQFHCRHRKNLWLSSRVSGEIAYFHGHANKGLNQKIALLN